MITTLNNWSEFEKRFQLSELIKIVPLLRTGTEVDRKVFKKHFPIEYIQ